MFPSVHDGTHAHHTTHVVDLKAFRDEELRIYTGRQLGRFVRAATGLDRLDEDPSVEHVIIKIPDDTWDVSTGFWLGMFGESVRCLGAEGFRTRYQFGGPVNPEDVEAGIEDALCEMAPLRFCPG